MTSALLCRAPVALFDLVEAVSMTAAAAAAADNDGFPAGDGVMDLAVACVVAGLVASWLFRRVRGRLGRVDPGATAARGSRVW